MLRAIKKLTLDVLFPPACLTCNKHLIKEEKYGLVCGQCFVSIPIYNSFFCPICLRRLPRETLTKWGDLCHPQSHYLLAPAASYSNDKVQRLLWQMKYKSWLTASEPVIDLLTAYFHSLSPMFGCSTSKHWLVVPVPLFPKRELKRGFNQAAVLAAAISQRFFLPLERNNLIRVKDTKAQAELEDYSAREKNLQDAFMVIYPATFKNKNIILVDDVFTSGATFSEAVRVLKLAGAKKILALVVARAR